MKIQQRRAKTIHLLPDETAGSLVFRLAQAEFLSVADYCRAQFNLSYARIRSDLDSMIPNELAQSLALIAAVSVNQIRQLAIQRKWRLSTWNSDERRHSAAVRFCPICLRQSKHGRRFWLTYFAAACPIHFVELLDHCPSCGAVVPYFGAPGGILVQYWLETWPLCPRCFREISSPVPANRVLVEMSQRWREAIDGVDQLGMKSRDFLRFSRRLIDRFTNKTEYQQTAVVLGAAVSWPAHAAAALLLDAILRGNISKDVFHAAIDSDFTPSQLAKDIKV